MTLNLNVRSALSTVAQRRKSRWEKISTIQARDYWVGISALSVQQVQMVS